MKGHRDGGKYGGGHTTLLEPSQRICDFLNGLDSVVKISPGYIQMPNSRRRGGSITVKLANEPACERCVLITVVQHGSMQELRFFVANNADRQVVKLALSRFVRENNWNLRFGKDGT